MGKTGGPPPRPGPPAKGNKAGPSRPVAPAYNEWNASSRTNAAADPFSSSSANNNNNNHSQQNFDPFGSSSTGDNFADFANFDKFG